MISLLWLIIIFLFVIPFIPENSESSEIMPFIGVAILYLVTGILIWMLLDTNYKIDNIHNIERWNKWYVSSFLKPALDNDGLVIYYEKFDDIYISPKNKGVFIAALREINPEIKIV
ncbi:PH domain-containing protein [Flavobacterium tegetincola]|uniref:PH domain-containing protein n=1 Tax=Flavobacterium tegetincola TaxID=150172 RepID=UPI0005541BAD|nr:PH domain-containing protein [Flavobacterium tegetincola]